MSELSKEVESLRNSGTPWTEVFRKILPLIPEGQDPRMTLFRELKELYGFNIGTLLEVGAWNVWEKDGLDDEKVNHLLDSSLSGKE